MEISRLVVMEILTNVTDLYFLVGHEKLPQAGTEKWGLLISRASGDEYRPLVSTEAIFYPRAQAMEALGNILDVLVQESVRSGQTFTDELKERILQEIDKNGFCETSALNLQTSSVGP